MPSVVFWVWGFPGFDLGFWVWGFWVLRRSGLGVQVRHIPLRLKIAQKPSIVWSLGPNALKSESLEPKGKGSQSALEFRRRPWAGQGDRI